MAKKRFNSKFYCQEYISVVPTRRASEDTIIPCCIYGESITKSLIDELEQKFDFFLKGGNEERNLGSCCYRVNGFMKKANMNKAKEDLKKNGFDIRFDTYVSAQFKLPEGYLYSGWKTGRRTKIKPEDLPESYVYLSNYKKNGFLETAGVVDIVYHPSPFHNHTFKDDFLFISYSRKFADNGQNCNFDMLVDGCDEYVFGNDIISVVHGIELNNKDDEQLIQKIQKIKSDMVKQYNAYAEEMKSSFGRKVSYIEDFSELLGITRTVCSYNGYN